MLIDLYPRVHRRYSSLPVLGTMLEGYGEWLFEQGYPRHRVRMHFRSARRLDSLLHRCRVLGLDDLTRERLRACAPKNSQDDTELSALVTSLERYLDAKAVFAPAPLSRIQIKVASYASHLDQVRGVAPSTISHHQATAIEFLAHLCYETRPTRLTELTARDVEGFVRVIGKRVSRASLQHVVAQLRGFLRFLASAGEAPPGLDGQIDTPRLYRGEQLPRALPWDTVRAFLGSIDRTKPLGLRDYAIFLLITTYGLRSCEVVALTLDDIEWRAERIRIPQRKTGGSLWVPLMDDVGTALLDYLHRGRPALTHREVFLRCRAPAAALKPTAVTEAFQGWSKRCDLHISFQGAHCLRHSYAIHLLRQGASLKTIGDLLGHRSPESTYVYLRLAVEDLREVALSLPNGAKHRDAREVAP